METFTEDKNIINVSNMMVAISSPAINSTLVFHGADVITEVSVEAAVLFPDSISVPVASLNWLVNQVKSEDAKYSTSSNPNSDFSLKMFDPSWVQLSSPPTDLCPSAVSVLHLLCWPRGDQLESHSQPITELHYD